MNRDTSAGRLLDAFDAVRDVQDRGPFRELWAKALGHGVDTADEVRNMTEVAALLRSVETAATILVETCEYEREGLLFGYQRWGKAVLGLGYKLTTDQVFNGPELIDNDTRHSLAAFHSVLRSVLREPTIREEERETTLTLTSQGIAEVLTELRDADLPNDVDIRLGGPLAEANEAMELLRFRGDAALFVPINQARSALVQLAETSSTSSLTTHAQQRIESWANTISHVSTTLVAAFTAPLLTAYFLNTGDWANTVFLGALQAPRVSKAMLRNALGPGNDETDPNAS